MSGFFAKKPDIYVEIKDEAVQLGSVQAYSEGLAGWFVSEPSEAAGVAAGAILATLIALLAGVHGEAAISLIGSGAFIGFFLSAGRTVESRPPP